MERAWILNKFGLLTMTFGLISLVFSTVMFLPQIALAANNSFDASAFKINSLKIVSKGPYAPLGEILIEMDVACGANGFHLSDIEFSAVHEDDVAADSFIQPMYLGSVGGVDPFGNIWPTEEPTLRSGKHIIGLEIPSGAKTGKWTICSVTSGPQLGDPVKFAIPSDEDQLAFVVDSKLKDTTAPILYRAIPSESYQGEMVQVQLCFDSPDIKWVRVRVSANSGIDFADYTGRLVDSGDRGTKCIYVQLPYNAKLGNWTVDEVEAEDLAGNRSLYKLTSGESPSGKVLGRTDSGFVRADTVAVRYFQVKVPTDREVKPPAPSITSFTVLNENLTVQRPGILRVRVGIHEESGATTRITLWGSREDGESSIDYSFGPFGSGTHILELPIPSSAYIGNWKLGADISDSFGNWRHIENSSIRGANGLLAAQSTQYLSSTASYSQVTGLPGFKVTDEFDYAVNLSLSYPRLTEQIKQMNDGKAARIRINGNGVLPASVFDALKGTRKTIVCWADSYQWIFRGQDIVKQSKDVNLLLQIGRVPGTDLGITQDAVSLDFKSNGVLPGKAEVRFKSDYLYSVAGIKGALKLYFVDGIAYKQESTNFDLVFDGTDRWCYVDILHNSRFLVATQSMVSQKKSLNNAKTTGSLSKIYTGKAISTNGVKIKLGSKVLKEGVDYTKQITNSKGKAIKASSVKGIGQYYLVFKGKGNYTGTKKISFQVIPKGSSLKKVVPLKGKVRIGWKQQLKMIDGYQVRYATSKKMAKAKTKTVSGVKKASCVISKLKSGKKYYMEIRTYKKVGGKKYYSNWSKQKVVKVR